MDKDTNGADLATPDAVETATNDAMTEMTADQFAQYLMSKVPKPGESKTDEVAAEATEEASEATEAVDDKAEKEVAEGESEQEPEAADSPETEVLSQSDTVPPEKKAKWEASVQKRIDKEVAKTKALEAKLAVAEAKLAAPRDEPEAQAPVIVPLDHPDDKTAAGTTETLAGDTYNIHDVTLDENVTFTFTTSATVAQFTLILRQDGSGGNSVTWPASVKWHSLTAPTILTTASAVHVLEFLTVNSGTTWRGFLASSAVS